MEEEMKNENEDMEDVEVDMIEISLDEDEIDEWIEKLMELKETKNSTNFELDSENELMISYEESSEEEDDSDEGDEDDTD